MDTHNNAIAFEKQVKDRNRAKKEALIKGDIKNLKVLAVPRNSSHHSNFNE